MGINVYPQPSDAGKPVAAKKLIFGGYSSLGVYSYTGTLPAGVYVAEIRLATTSALTYVGSQPNSTISPVNNFTISGNLGGTYASGIVPATFQPVGSNASNNWLYTPQTDFTYINIPSTDTGITITGGYIQKTGTTISTWTKSTTQPFIVSDITSLDAEGNNITVGTGPADGFSYRYYNPEILYSSDNGSTWTRGAGQGDFSSSTWPINNFTNGGETNVFSYNSTLNWIRYVGDKYYYLNSASSGPRLAWSEDLNSWWPTENPYLGNTTDDVSVDMAYNTANGGYISVSRKVSSAAGHLSVSPDGYYFNASLSPVSSAAYGAAYGNGVYVVGTGGAYVLRSTDGLTWTTTAFSTGDLRRGLYGTRFVFCGNGTYFAHSTDGVTWATSVSGFTAGGNFNAKCIAYGNSVYVAGNGSGQITRSTDGITWSTTGITTNFAGQSVNSIAYGNSIFVAVGGSGTIRTSTDGLVWATRSYSPSTTADILGMDYGHKGFFAVAPSSALTFVSTDGISWNVTRHTTGGTGIPPVWTTISGIPKKSYSIVARRVQYSSNPGVYASFWGSSWGGLAGIGSYGNTVSSSGNVFARQAGTEAYGDMRAYLSYPSGNAYGLAIFGKNTSGLVRTGYSIDNATFVSAGGSGPLVGFGGSNRVRPNAAISVPQKNIYVIAGEKGALSTATSVESTWTSRVSTFGLTRINALTFGGLFVAAGDSGQLRTSTDAITWTTRTSGFGSNAIRALGWNGLIYIAGGDNGTLTTSTDAITWTVRTSGFGTNSILCMTASVLTKFPDYTPPTVTAIGGKNGSFATSTDGVTWTTKHVPYYSLSVQDINYNGSQYYAVGTNAPFRTGTYFTTPVNAYPYYSQMTQGTTYGPVLLASSTDGISWTRINLYDSVASGNLVLHSPSIAHKSGAGYILSANNGAVWSTASLSAGPLLRSTDGVTWATVATTLTQSSPRKVKVANNIFFAWNQPSDANNNTNILSQSTDSITWTTVALPSKTRIKDISYLNGNYFVTGFGSFFYTSQDLSFWIPRGISSVYISAYDSSTSKYIVFTETGRVYSSTDLVTWTEGSPLGYSYPYKVVSAGTGKFIVSTSLYGQDFAGGSNTYAYNINEVALYGDPVNGWMPTVPSSISEINSISDGGFAYNSTDSKVVSSFGTLDLQYGTLSSGTVSFGTSVPTFISLYSTDQGALN